jgi:DNA-binding NarL/FixJ family response regulator
MPFPVALIRPSPDNHDAGVRVRISRKTDPYRLQPYAQELRVADLVRQGRTSKEIADLLNSSVRAVEFHRINLRKKLNLKEKKTNLRSFLLSMKQPQF